MRVAEKIRRYLKETGRTQAYLCKRTGINGTALSLSLNEKRRLQLEEYCEICKALCVDPGFFLR